MNERDIMSEPRTRTKYGYDNLNRILTAQAAATSGVDCWAQAFGNGTTAADDSVGNLLNINAGNSCPTWTLSVGVNSDNQITTPSGFSYDAAGNSTADGSFSYTYDAEGRIIAASGMTGGPYCYTYDGNGVRVIKANVSGGSCPAASQSQVDVLYWRSITGDTIAETDGTGSTTNSNYHEYIFFAGRRVARSDPPSGSVYFYFVDQLGSTRSVAQWNASTPSTDGAVCFSLDYYPYGQELDYTTSCPQNYRFTGYEEDLETAPPGNTGNYYAFARYYNPRMARFMSPDPLAGVLGAPQSHNAYSYVINNPPNIIDPSGLCPKGTHPATPEEAKKIVAAANALLGQNIGYQSGQPPIVRDPATGAVTACDCTGFVNLSATGAGFSVPYANTSAILNQTGTGVYFQPDNAVRVGDVLVMTAPNGPVNGHAMLVGSVAPLRLLGSQSTGGPRGQPGPAQVPPSGQNLSQAWRAAVLNSTAYQICLPDPPSGTGGAGGGGNSAGPVSFPSTYVTYCALLEGQWRCHTQ